MESSAMKDSGQKFLRENKTSILVVVTVGILVTILVIVSYLPGRLEGKVNSWLPLGVPPGKAIQIVDLAPVWQDQSLCIYIENTDGKYYRNCQARANVWIELHSLEPSPNYTFQPGQCKDILEYTRKSFLEQTPEQIVDCAKFSWSFEWVTNDTYVAVLDDGSVWTYTYKSSVWPIILTFLLPFIVLACLGVIVLVGLVAMLIGFVKRKIAKGFEQDISDNIDIQESEVRPTPRKP